MVPILLLIALLAVSSSVRSNATLVCPKQYNAINGLCIKLFTTSMRHADAVATCAEDNGHLVAIHNAIDNTGIVNAVIEKTQSSVWIGLKCSQDSDPSSCLWDNNSGNAQSYNNFAPGYPLPTSLGNCVFMATVGQLKGKWVSADCDQLQTAFVCETAKVNPDGDDCPYQFGGYCYFPTLTALTESDAEYSCIHEECGNLVSIHSGDENLFVMSLFANNVPTYIRIGGMSTGATTFAWTDGTAFDYNNVGYANQQLGQCLSMALKDDIVGKSKWINSHCETSLPFVCKRKAGKGCGTTVGPTQSPSQCNGPQFYDNSGTFYSPSWPYTYAGAAGVCSYVISTPLGSKALIQFPVLQLDPSATIALYNQIEDSNPFQVLKAGTVAGQWYSSTTNTMKVMFRPSSNLDGATNVYRWQANFKPSIINPTASPPVTITPDPLNPSGCNNTLLAAPGQITSPNYPNLYPNYLECLYHLTTDGGYRIRLDFDEVQTERCCDIIVVHDGPELSSPEMGRLSGSIPAHTKIFQSTSNSMLVTFTTDSSGQAKGFRAYYGAV
ncbi:unnamed protein product [Caenorhabditis bovis]|uniref:CUB domain-containing protein n=1 Tax=Caenorhabditis bovis TaxID=2654633 RepID=A0A8S1E5Z7_9PELO|nr:unnamed protein product [Caenorhabditis bovis]